MPCNDKYLFSGIVVHRRRKIELIESHRLLTNDLDDLTLKVERLVGILVDLKDKFEPVKGRGEYFSQDGNCTCNVVEPIVPSRLVKLVNLAY